MKIELLRRLVLTDEQSRMMKDTGLVPSHSYVLQFLQLVEGCMLRSAGGTPSHQYAKDVDGTSQILWKQNTALNQQARADGPAGNDGYGIVVGTNAGSTPEDNENYSLDTKILHSAVGDAGKLNYHATTFIEPRTVGVNIDLDISRSFDNATGSTITVKEIGLQVFSAAETKYWLLMRDVVSDEDVLDGYTLTVGYTLRTTA